MPLYIEATTSPALSVPSLLETSGRQDVLVLALLLVIVQSVSYPSEQEEAKVKIGPMNRSGPETPGHISRTFSETSANQASAK